AWLAEDRRIWNRQAEVDQLDDAFLIDHDVARADVAVQELHPMQVLQRLGDLAQVVDAVAVQAGTAGLNQEVESHAVDQFHDDILLTGGRDAVLVGLDDVLGAQGAEHGTLAGPVHLGEAGLEALGLDLVEELEADVHAGLHIAGAPDLRHAALAG